MRLATAVFLIVAATPTAAYPQSAVVVRGRVTATDAAPVVNARVALISAAVGAPVVLSDDDGRFALAIPKDATNARVAIVKTGFGRVETAALSDRALDVRLARGAAVAGRVVDEFGEGVQSARLYVQRFPAASTDPNVATSVTNDRGEYRIAGLPSGSYVISTAANAGWATTRNGNFVSVRAQISRIYHPNAATPEASEPLRLEAGDDRDRVDFTVPGGRSLGPSLVLMQPSPLMHPPASANGVSATGVIRGQVVTADRRSVPRAQLRLSAAADLRATAFRQADADGQFEFPGLPPGKYGVLAAKAGYSMSDRSFTVELTEGETRDRVSLVVRRWGSVAGVVKDEHGDPVQSAAVQLLRVQFEAGRRRLVPANVAAALTDDLGRYRIYDVPPGRFAVTASVTDVMSAELPGYARVFYPATPNGGQAQFITVGESQDVPGIDLGLLRTRTARVAGKLIDAAGAPSSGGNVVLLPARASTSPTYVGAGARIDPDGQFEFTNVAPGQYVIHASRGRLDRSTEGEFGTLPVSVDGADVTGLTLQTSAGSSIHGRFTFDSLDSSKAPGRARLELSPIPVDADLSPQQAAIADIHEDWTFDMRGVNGPRRLELLGVPNGWSLREIRVNGVDATDRIIAFGRPNQSLRNVEVILTDRVSELAVVVGDREAQSPAASVVVFSTDRGRWYVGSRFMRATAALPDGSFQIVGLPFGTYLVAAVARLPDEGDDAWRDPGFLETLSRGATTVTVRDGEKQLLQIRGFSAK